MRRFVCLSVIGLLCFSLLACAPNAPKVKRTGLKPVNEAYLYPKKGEKGGGSTLSIYSEGRANAR